jgi:hypothetical protein
MSVIVWFVPVRLSALRSGPPRDASSRRECSVQVPVPLRAVPLPSRPSSLPVMTARSRSPEGAVPH